MNTDEIKYNIIPSPYDNRDWMAGSIYSDNIKLPKMVDLRNNLKIPRQQGSQGSCAAQSAACMKEWQEKKDVGYSDYMSPQFIYNNRKNQSSEGMYCRDVMKILYNIGSCYEKTYPYGTIEIPEIIDQKAYLEASNFKINSYAMVNTIIELK